MNTWIRVGFAVVAIGMIFAFGITCQAAPVIQHTGTADPTTEGWTLAQWFHPEWFAGSAGTAAAGTGSWDIFSGVNSSFNYGSASTAVANATADLSGWTMTAEVKQVGNSSVNVGFDVYDGTTMWVAYLTDSGLCIQGSGLWSPQNTSIYHIYQMIYNPAASDRIALYVDGTSVASVLRSQAAASAGTYGVDFGDLEAVSTNAPTANWKSVSFEAGQHPYSPPPPPEGVLIQHVGTAVPTTETDGSGNPWVLGTYLMPGGTPGVAGPGATEGGVNYWPILSGSGSNLYYQYQQTALTSAVAYPTGWTVTAKLKVVGTSNNADIATELADGQNRWMLYVKSSGISLLGPSGPAYSLGMDTTNAYHTYQLIYNPATPDRVNVYVDGAANGYCLRSSAVTSTDAPYFIFGDEDAGSTNAPEARYSLVSFETGQHPVTLTLGGISGTVSLANFSGNKLLVPILIELYKGATFVSRQTMTTDVSNSYGFTLLTPDTYNLHFTTAQFLKKIVSGVVVNTAATTTVPEVSLINGDTDGDNVITSTDLSTVLSNLGVPGD